MSEGQLKPSIELAGAGRDYQTAAGHFTALHPTCLSLHQGSFTALVGRSGSGKSTLLNLIAGIDHPTCGAVCVAGTDLTRLSESQLAAFRGRTVGFVFQFFQLLPTLTAVENVRLAMDLVGTINRADRPDHAQALLERVGLADHRNKLPASLSGGEQQRVAIARALANDPPIIVADEPTGNLDSSNSAIVDRLFRDCANEGRTVLVATHDDANLRQFDQVLRLADGALASSLAEES